MPLLATVDVSILKEGILSVKKATNHVVYQDVIHGGGTHPDELRLQQHWKVSGRLAGGRNRVKVTSSESQELLFGDGSFALFNVIVEDHIEHGDVDHAVDTVPFSLTLEDITFSDMSSVLSVSGPESEGGRQTSRAVVHIHDCTIEQVKAVGELAAVFVSGIARLNMTVHDSKFERCQSRCIFVTGGAGHDIELLRVTMVRNHFFLTDSGNGFLDGGSALRWDIFFFCSAYTCGFLPCSSTLTSLSLSPTVLGQSRPTSGCLKVALKRTPWNVQQIEYSAER